MEKVLIRELKIEDADDITRIHAAITQSPVKIDYKRVIEEQVGKADEASYVIGRLGEQARPNVERLLKHRSDVVRSRASAALKSIRVAELIGELEDRQHRQEAALAYDFWVSAKPPSG